MNDNIEIRIEEATETRPTLIKISFGPMPWYFAFHTSRLGIHQHGNDLKKHEARRAIQHFCYLLEKKMTDALPEDLK